ncbi:hypothetical protein CK203_076009 [Vitis vinifera]|uniref:Endonuclease/exonuclease/phosphatase domain-containing protein n=1 Tax=Vitis vinifera TaxID=29760 RepID=A0A438C1G5_VITVI|nr:hypothetical protein CK203_076009 [Vitis vinifera]
MTEGVVRSIGSGRFLDWGAMGAQGSAGGILVCWDKRSLELLELEVGFYSISCKLKTVENDVVWVFTGVYGPCNRKERELLWEELGAIRGIWDEPWCIGGDFNVTLSQRDRSRGVCILGVEEGIIRLGRDWIDSWYPRDGGRDEPGALSIQVMKEKIKVWNRDGFGRVEVNKGLALRQIEFWDRVESGRDLSEREVDMKNEAKENFKKWNYNKWGGIGGGAGGEGGIVKAFQQQLREEPGWRADLGGLHLKSLDHSEAEALEVPFTEEEIFAALMEMNGDKAPGPDGFTVAFWQACWDFAKEEILELFKELYDQKSFAKA